MRKFEELTDEEFNEFMSANGYYAVHVKDGHWYALYRFIFTAAIIKGSTKDYATGYSDRWCYHTSSDALTALYAWKVNNFQGEPHGWHRNPKTGRRRINGDEQTEYIQM